MTLEAKGLAKRYGDRWVTSNVSLSLSSGQVVGLLGPNGAGKTTSFYMIVGLVEADQGQILLNDEDITDLPMHERSRKGIGYLPQEPSVFRMLSVEDNIKAILETRSDITEEECYQQLDALLEEFNLTHIRTSMGLSLSGGERRRVEIARALAAEPKYILLDEPFAGVDPISVGDIKQIIEHLKNRGLGVLITDHNVRETLDVCENAYIVQDGHVIAEGDADHILANKKVRDVYLGEHFRL
jgi:lipopolysaccharide export system ATP-binding protein